MEFYERYIRGSKAYIIERVYRRVRLLHLCIATQSKLVYFKPLAYRKKNLINKIYTLFMSLVLESTFIHIPPICIFTFACYYYILINKIKVGILTLIFQPKRVLIGGQNERSFFLYRANELSGVFKRY